MTSRYVVFQYAPDPATGERINIGVAAYDDDVVFVQFLGHWKRVRAFAGKDITFLKKFANRVRDSADPTTMLTDDGPVVRLDADAFARMSERWQHSIQVTEPRVGVLPPRELLQRVSSRFLLNSATRRRDGLSRAVAARAAIVGVRAALQDEGPRAARELLKPHGVLRGQLTQNTFDALVQNGRPLLAAHGLSFQTKEAPQIEKDVNSVSFMLSDVRQKYPEMPLALVAIPPRFDTSGQYERAGEICVGLNVAVVNQDQVESWARPYVKSYLSLE